MNDAALWEELEAAGPLDWAASLDQPAPPGVDADSWAERCLTQADRRRTFIALYAAHLGGSVYAERAALDRQERFCHGNPG